SLTAALPELRKTRGRLRPPGYPQPRSSETAPAFEDCSDPPPVVRGAGVILSLGPDVRTMWVWW
ncbi:hypothetical protein XENOCAPTIV_022304, partial [Xenoophorus captivus]